VLNLILKNPKSFLCDNTDLLWHLLLLNFLQVLLSPIHCIFELNSTQGLIDDKEDAETAAARELLEETGYSGKVTAVSPPLALEPGLTNGL
jgi:hypothetical protein